MKKYKVKSCKLESKGNYIIILNKNLPIIRTAEKKIKVIFK